MMMLFSDQDFLPLEGALPMNAILLSKPKHQRGNREFDGKRGKAFTLVEILIVVVILGFLASLVIMLVGTPQKESAQAAFVTDIKSFAQSAMLYHAKNGDFLEDASSGMLPAGFEDYVNPNSWTAPTPIGGVWDTELDSYGIKSALGVHFNGVSKTQDDAYMTDVDSQFDDGNLTAGAFRKIDTGRYYFIIKE